MIVSFITGIVLIGGMYASGIFDEVMEKKSGRYESSASMVYCGDNKCDGSETCLNCPGDCKCVNEESCGEGVCTTAQVNETEPSEEKRKQKDTLNDGSGFMDGVVYGAGLVSLRGDKVLEFDGVDDHVVLGLGPDLGRFLSVEFWFRGDGLPSDGHDMFVAKYGSGRFSDGCWYVSSFMRRPYFSVQVGSVRKEVFGGGTVFADGEWYHVAATFDGSRGCVYVNGVLDSDCFNLSGAIVNTKSLYVGGSEEVGDFYFDGVMDNLRIYNTALSPEEVARHYMEDYSQDPAGNLRGLYEFDAK